MSYLHEMKVNEAVAVSLVTAISLVAGSNVALDIPAAQANRASTLADRVSSARESLFAVEPTLKTRAHRSVHVAQWTNVQ